jgi:hypothetical protein
MDLERLKKYLGSLTAALNVNEQKLLRARLKGLISAFPFNEYEFSLMFFLDQGIISFKQYEKLRQEYVAANKYLDLYALAPRIFGEIWGHAHIKDIDQRFHAPNRRLDPNFQGQYDLWFNGIRVEIKAARAINKNKRAGLSSKALKFEAAGSFWMNFQQIKLEVADVFVFIGVWADRIIYWVLSNREIKANKYLSHQHRGGIEHQIGITDKNIHDFDQYKVVAAKLGAAVIRKAERRSR